MAPIPVPVASPPPPPPVPPPPPPALGGPQNATGSNKSLEQGQTETKEISEEEFIKEIVELVKRLPAKEGQNDLEDDQVILMVAIPLKTVILQNGPMCGIVALAEALEMLNLQNKGPVSAKVLLSEAIQKGYTKQGEMFSIRAMQSLAENYRAAGVDHVNSKILNVSKDQGPGRFEELLREIILHNLKGYPILFPYDADYNHTPSLRKGHAAHWAVIHGLVNYVSSSQLSSIVHPSNNATASSPPFQVLHSSPNLVILKPSAAATNFSGANAQNEITLNFLADQFMCSKTTHVISHQGKSFHTALWKYADLLESNNNLKEVAPKILANPHEFILFEGIEEGLCSQILLLQ